MEECLRKIAQLHPHVAELIEQHIEELGVIEGEYEKGCFKEAPDSLSPHLAAIWYLGQYNLETVRISGSNNNKQIVNKRLYRLSRRSSGLSKATRMLDREYYNSGNILEGVDYYATICFFERNKGR